MAIWVINATEISGHFIIATLPYSNRTQLDGHNGLNALGLGMVTLIQLFFHNQARIRNHKNHISMLLNDVGIEVSNHVSISGCFTNFYSNMWDFSSSSSSSSVVDFLCRALPNDLNTTLNEHDRSFITRTITRAEIFQTLKSMPKGKSPRSNGLNVEFYIFYWNVVKDSLCDVVQWFFCESCSS